MFHFESQLPQPQAAAELVAAAEVAAEWFQIGEYNGQGESFDFPKPCRWGPPMSLVRANRFAPLAPTHEIRSIVELDVLADFEVEMLLSGVGQQHMDWNAVNRPALVWPVKDFDLPSHLCSLGLAIEQRLSSMSAFFGAISREVPAWVLEPKAQLAVCGSPLTPADTEGFVQRLNVPMDRVRIATPEEHLCNSHLPVD